MTPEAQIKPNMTVLSPIQIEQIHAYSLRILSQVGLRVDSERARRIFSEAEGIRIEAGRVTIQSEQVECALKSVPATIQIYNRKGEPTFSLGNNRTRFGIGVTNLFYQDPVNDQVTPFQRPHMAIGARLGQSLPAYDVVSTLGILRDVAPGKDDLYGVLEMAANTTKPLIILISDEKQFTPVLDMLEHLTGNLARKPFVIPYFNPVTPLVINRETGDKMLDTIERGLPLIYSNYSMAGATTPITPAGTLALMNAELLAGLVLSQLAHPGTPIILGSLPAFFDMKSMIDFYDPQTILLNAVCAEMMAFYHIPHAGTSGSGIGWGADIPAAGLHWLNHLTACLGQTGLSPFVGGSLGSKAFSPASVVYSHEVILQARRFVDGFVLNDESAVLDEIKKAGPGGNFLTARSTRQHFREAYYTSPIFPHLSLEKWQELGQPKASELLRKYTLQLIDEARPPEDHQELLGKGEEFIMNL